MGGRQRRWENKIIVVGRWFPRPNRKPVFKPLFQFHGLPSPSSCLKNSKVIIIVEFTMYSYNVTGKEILLSSVVDVFPVAIKKRKKELKRLKD